MNPNGLTYWPAIAALDEIKRLRAERGSLLAENMKLAKELEDLRTISLQQAVAEQRLLAENSRLTEALLNQVQREGHLGAVRVYCDPRVPKLQAELEDVKGESTKRGFTIGQLQTKIANLRYDTEAWQKACYETRDRLTEAQDTLRAIAAAAKSVSA